MQEIGKNRQHTVIHLSDFSNRNTLFSRKVIHIDGNSLCCCKQNPCDYSSGASLTRTHISLFVLTTIFSIIALSIGSSTIVIAEHGPTHIIDSITLGCFFSILVQSIFSPLYLCFALRRDTRYTDLLTLELRSHVYHSTSIPKQDEMMYYAIKSIIELYRFLAFDLFFCSFLLMLFSIFIYKKDFYTALVLEASIVIFLSIWHFYIVLSFFEYYEPMKSYLLQKGISLEIDIIATSILGFSLILITILGTSYLIQ